jgi:hypothetical protein
MAHNQGWHGDSKGHSKAAKGQRVRGSSSNSGQGWHGDSKGHSKAAKGEKATDSGNGGGNVAARDDLLDDLNTYDSVDR